MYCTFFVGGGEVQGGEGIGIVIASVAGEGKCYHR